MPLQIKVLQNGDGIEFMSSGVVTGKEIIEANKTFYTPENLSRLKYKIVDRTSCSEYLVTSEEVQIIADQDIKASKINPNIIIALISTTDLQYGVSRMWEAFVDASGFQTGIFRDRKSADLWLKEKLGENPADAEIESDRTDTGI